jgi:hypothetical protein
MRSIKVAFVAIVKTVAIKNTKKEIPYLSLDCVAGTDVLRCWVTMFGSDIEALAGKLRPDGEAYVEGTLKLKADSAGDAFLHCNAEVLTPLFNIGFDPKPKRKPLAAAAAKPKQADHWQPPPSSGRQYDWHEKGGDELPENLLG